jgi:hypothetical protein
MTVFSVASDTTSRAGASLNSSHPPLMWVRSLIKPRGVPLGGGLQCEAILAGLPVSDIEDLTGQIEAAIAAV